MRDGAKLLVRRSVLEFLCCLEIVGCVAAAAATAAGARARALPSLSRSLAE